MSKDVFLVISDLHKAEGTSNVRKDYRGEVKWVEDEIHRLIDFYKDSGCKVVLLFLGDVVHRSFKNVDNSLKAFTELQKLCVHADGAYLTVGNHDMNNPHKNPLWWLVSDARQAPSILTKIHPKGSFDFLKVADRLEFGDVEFLFNHYGTEWKSTSSGKVSIGLFHQDVMFSQILEDMKKKYEMENYDYGFNYLDEKPSIGGYDILFIGHSHMTYGKYTWVSDVTPDESAELYWLASLGRTNEREVSDFFLERNIPAVVCEDGKFSRVEDNLFTLPCREDSVNEDVIEKNRNEREFKKQQKNIQRLSFSENPIENLKASFSHIPMMISMIDHYVKEEPPLEVGILRKQYSEVNKVD